MEGRGGFSKTNNKQTKICPIGSNHGEWIARVNDQEKRGVGKKNI